MIYDLFAVAVILMCVIVGYVRGAAKTIVSLVGFLTSFLLAIFLGDVLSNMLYDNYISTAVTESIKEYLSTQNGTTSINLPLFASFALLFAGYDYESALLSVIESAPTMITSSFEAMIKPVILSVLSFVFTAVIFTIVMFLYKLVARKVLMFVFELPVISAVNKLLGALCGVINAVLVLSFTAFLLKILMPYMNYVPYIFSESTIYNSYIFYHFYSGNIFNAIISIF